MSDAAPAPAPQPAAAPGARKSKSLPPVRTKMRLWYRLCRIPCVVFFYTFFRGRVFHAERVPLDGGVLLICNHQSFLDPVLATQALRRECHYMARDTLFRGGVFQRLIESLNAFPVKRATADIGAIKETLRRLKAGALVTVFPEATRTDTGAIAPMQPGVVLIAKKTGVPLVPCLIDGAFEAWPRHAKLPRPRRIVIAYGEPVYVEQMAGMNDEQIIEHVRQRIIALMNQYGRHKTKPEALSSKP